MNDDRDVPAPTFLGWLRYRLARIARWFWRYPPTVPCIQVANLADLSAVYKQMYKPDDLAALANRPSPLWAPARVISDVRAIRARDEQAEPEADK